LGRLEEARYAKVNQLDLSLRRQHHVGGLEVAEDDGGGLPVQVLEHIAQLAHDVEHLPLRQPFVGRILQYVFQRLPAHVIHHQVQVVSFGEKISDGGQARVI